VENANRVYLKISCPYEVDTFRPLTACTHAKSPLVIRYIEGFSHFVTSMTAPIASGWSKIAGWDLHPLRNAAFARRTPEAAFLPLSINWGGNPCVTLWRQTGINM